MMIDFLKYELPLLQALVELGGQAKTKSVYPVVEKILGIDPKNFPAEYETYKSGAIKWKNKTAWAREYLKRKGQLDGSVRGIWRITEAGKERIEVFLETSKDPDEGLAQIQVSKQRLKKTKTYVQKKVLILLKILRSTKPAAYWESGASSTSR